MKKYYDPETDEWKGGKWWFGTEEAAQDYLEALEEQKGEAKLMDEDWEVYDGI